MNNHYEVLGVQRDTGPSIVKIAYEGKLKALAKAGLADAERQAEEGLLERAYATLSDDTKRERYDQQLDQHLERQEKAALESGRRGWIVAVVAVLVVGASFGAYINNRNNARERIRLEEERIARERENAAREAELERARLAMEQQAEQARLDHEARQGAVRERRESSRNQSEYSYQDQEAAHQRALDYLTEQRAQEEEAKQRAYARQSEEDRRRALAEVERQKRFVAEREREEERIRAERAYRAQREAEAAHARDLHLKRDR